MATIDKAWFMEQLQNQGKSVRGLARHMDLDPSAVSRMLSGERRMRMEEAAEIARFLSAPVNEVINHAGVAIDLDGRPTRIILTSVITETGAMERLTDPRALPQSLIERAQAAVHGVNETVIAAQIRATDGPLVLWDDAIVLFRPTETVSHDAIDALAICRLHSGEQILAKIERARKTGEARVLDVANTRREVLLQTATPVLAVLP